MIQDNEKKYKVITLCGSTKFKSTFLELQKKLTLDGYIVLSLCIFGHSGDNEAWNLNTFDMLNEMHLQKIRMSDMIYVVNVDGYIGEGGRREIEYALKLGKEVKYLEGDL